MPALPPDSPQSCSRCSQPLTPGALECGHCHALVHSADMEHLAAEARALEAQSRLLEARDRWLSILPLLPAESKQAEWIRDHARELESAAPAAQRPEAPGTGRKWAKRLAPLAPLALILGKLKGVLFALKFLLSFASFIALYWAIWGLKFGIGFAVLVLIHELGHYIDIKRRGLPADMPMFLPGLGAYVRWNGMGVTQEVRSAVALAGPLAGWLAAVACGLIWKQTGDPLWAALARVGAWFNVLNLTPLWIFDGAQAAKALIRVEISLLMLVGAGLGYATKEPVFYIVAVGTVVALAISFFAKASIGGPTIRLGLSQPAPATGNLPAPPADPAMPRHESHFIAAYFLAVLTALALVLWWVPGHGNGLP